MTTQQTKSCNYECERINDLSRCEMPRTNDSVPVVRFDYQRACDAYSSFVDYKKQSALFCGNRNSRNCSQCCVRLIAFAPSRDTYLHPNWDVKTRKKYDCY